MSSNMDHIFVRAGRPLRIHFDTIHLGAAVGQFNHTVERLGGVVVGLPAESDVLVVDPSEPWVFHDFIKTRRPELRPSVVLGFWIPLCLTTRRLVWITDPCWPKVSVPLEQPTYPEMLPGVFAYTSFVAGVKFSKILSSTESTPVTSSRQRDPDDTFMSDAGRSVSEVSREIAPGSDSDEDQMLARARKKSKLRSLRFRSTSAGRASPAGADVTLPSADEAEVSGMVPEVEVSLPVEDVDMVPVAPLPEPSATEKEAPPPNGRVSPADAADQPATSLQSPKAVAVSSSPQPTAPSVQPAESAPTPAALKADTPSAPASARPAAQTPSPRPQVLVIESPTPPPPDTPASSQIAQKDASASASPLVAPKTVSNEHTRAETGPSAPQSSELPVTDSPASSKPSTPAVQGNRSAATQDASLTKPNGPAISESSSAKSTPLVSTNAPLGSNVSTKATQPSVPPPTPSSEPAPPKPAAATPAQKAASKSTVTASAPTATPGPKTPAAAKPSPLSTSSTGLKYRLESSSGRKLTLVHESSTSGGSSENATTPGSASKPRPRPKMRPVPPPEDDEPERPVPSSSAPTATTPRPSAPQPKTKLHIRLGSSSAKAQAKSAGSDEATSTQPSQSTAASSSQPTAPTPSPATTVAATPSALTPATSLATIATATPASQKTTSSAPTPGSTIKLPKKLKIRSPTHSTVPPRPSPSKAADEPVFIPSGVTPPPVPPTPTPEQLASKRPPWTKEEDQYIIDYMNWAFAQDRLASTSEIMKEIGANCPYRSVGNWQNRFTAKEDSIYMHSVPVLFERLTNRTSGSVRKDNRSTLEILSGTRTRNRKAADYAGSSSDEERGGIKSQRKRARVSSQGTRR